MPKLFLLRRNKNIRLEESSDGTMLFIDGDNVRPTNKTWQYFANQKNKWQLIESDSFNVVRIQEGQSEPKPESFENSNDSAGADGDNQ